jgi:Uma2 family endonuclease
MALAHIHRFTTDEFLLLDLPERVELIDGTIYDMSPEGPRHAVAQLNVGAALKAALPDFVVAGGGTMVCADDFCPIPDVAVYRPGADEKKWFEVGDVELVVEVGLTTLARNRTVKLARYAQAGVPRLWLVAPTAGTLTLCSSPDTSTGRYAEVSVAAWPEGLQASVEGLARELRGPTGPPPPDLLA